MGEVIIFPKEKAKRAISQRKKEGQKTALIISLMSLVLVAVFTNERLTQSQREVYIISDNATGIEKLNRAIASAQPVTMYRDLEWEAKLAHRLNAAPVELSRIPASSTSRVELVDQLRFGELRGKYRLVQEPEKGLGLIREIEYIESLEAGDRPIVYKDRKAFLEQYKKAFSIDFANTELDQKRASGNESEEIFKLLSSGKKIVGKAIVKTDTEGRLISVRLSSSEK